MSGLYNELFGWNSACLFFAPMLTEENPQSFFPRFRDCYLSDDQKHIEIFTRVGGGNREAYWEDIERLRSMPTYEYDEDDSFDCTYATFTFGVPEEWREDFDKILALDFGELSEEYVERMQGCYRKADVRSILKKLTSEESEG